MIVISFIYTKDDMFEYFFRVRSEQISLFRFLLEGYDGLATLSTLDVDTGLVQTQVPESRLTEFIPLMASISPLLKKPN